MGAGWKHAAGAKLTIASEELHWVLLVSGFLLCDSELGDRDIVPPQLMQFSAALEAEDPANDPVCIVGLWCSQRRSLCVRLVFDVSILAALDPVYTLRHTHTCASSVQVSHTRMC